MNHFRSYSGSIDNIAADLRHARVGLQLELCGLERRLWTETQAGELIKQWLPTIREHLTACEALVREIETTMTSIEEEQEAAKEVVNDAA